MSGSTASSSSSTHSSANDARSSAKWYRRPSPNWVLPFIMGAVLSLGMNLAPKQELFVSLACLAHPPKQNFTAPAVFGIASLRADLYEGATVGEKDYQYTSISHLSGDKNARAAAEPRNVWKSQMWQDSGAFSYVSLREGQGQKDIDIKLCRKDPEVQAIAAKFAMSMSLVLGILGALTTGFWGQQSDKVGRTRILAVAEFGLLCSDVSVILVTTFPNLAPGGYRFLIIGPIIEGSLGGISTLHACLYAYISDTTPEGSRAKLFSRMTGLATLGFAAGPAIGSFVVSRTGNILSTFYITSAIHFLYVLAILGFMPESLSPKARKASARHSEEVSQEGKHPRLRWSTLGSWLASWLGALTVFLPNKVEGRGRRDWSLACLAATIFLMDTMDSVFNVIGQYLIYAYGWATRQLGFFLTATGIARAVALLVVLPIIYHFARPKSQKDAEASETTPLAGGDGKDTKSVREARFDLRVVRYSIGLETIAYACITIPLSAALFTSLTALATFGAGGPPAATSLALALLPDRRDTGRLFGGFAMLSALSTRLIGPLLFGSVYAATIGSHPTAVFAVAAAALVLAQVFLAFVKVPNTLHEDDDEGSAAGDEDGRD